MISIGAALARRILPLMQHESSSIIHIPAMTALQHELNALLPLPRNEAITAIKHIRSREMETLAKHFHEHINEMTGVDMTIQITAIADSIIVHLITRAAAKVTAPADWQKYVGVFAIGGYGRGELNPYSDIDLLILSIDSKQPAWLAPLNAELQSSMWDVKFTVGASLRSISELERILDDDYITATAVMEQRPLLANTQVTKALHELMLRFRDRRGVPFLKYKLDELAKRREQAGVSLFQMEPNLKSNPGCLRDVQLLRNMAFIVSGSRNLLNLSELEVVTRKDLLAVNAANEHVLRLRTLLHFKHARKQDIFQLPDQLAFAKLLGYEAISQLRAVEYFMKYHYALVLHVHQTIELVISRLRAKGHLGRWTLLIKTRKTIDRDFSAIQGQVYVSRAEFWSEPDVGAKLMRMCRVAQERGFRLSLELQRTIRTHLDQMTDSIRHDPTLGRVFLQIVGDLGRTRFILEDMHNCGLLGAYLPEFGNLTCHMQFDSYHQFTVDQHTLFAMGNLDAVINGTQKGLHGMSELLPRIKRKDLLGLGLLLHDMGKYMGRGHVARGAMMVEQVAKRMGLNREEEDIVHWLVDKHVSLSDASRMRDFHEPAFLQTFTEKMGNREQLDLLYCLTYADAKAVGEGVLTGWQEAILHELYVTVIDQLKQLPAEMRLGRLDRLIADLAKAGVKQTQANEFIAELGEHYLHQVPPGEIDRHYAVLQEAKQSKVGLSHGMKDKYVLIAAALPDRHALFSDVTATLTGHGFDILDARTWVTKSGMVLYSFRTVTIYPSRVTDDAAWQRLRRDLTGVSEGTVNADMMLEKRRQQHVGAKPANSVFDDPAIKVEQRTSDSHTIVDVHVKDDVGLLSRICGAISDFGCEIGYACINTMGDVAVDVFYVSRRGSKLTDDEAEGLRRHIIAKLGLTMSA
jgi:[protein-PII] uridylyltransferase